LIYISDDNSNTANYMVTAAESVHSSGSSSAYMIITAGERGTT